APALGSPHPGSPLLSPSATRHPPAPQLASSADSYPATLPRCAISRPPSRNAPLSSSVTPPHQPGHSHPPPDIPPLLPTPQLLPAPDPFPCSTPIARSIPASPHAPDGQSPSQTTAPARPLLR